MSELKLYCSIGNHARCTVRGCSCDCHDARSTPPPVIGNAPGH